MKIYFDGGCRPNPGEMEAAVVARGVLTHRPALGRGSSEQAEWMALLLALEVAQALGERDVLLLGDAKGVIAQATGEAAGPNPTLLACRDRFNLLSEAFDRVRLRYVKRQQNLAGIALGKLRQESKVDGSATREPG